MKVVNKIFFIIKLIIFVLYLNVSYAVEFRGAAVETYKGSSSKKKINATLEIAKEKACKNAFRKYVQGMEESKRMIFEGLKTQIYQNLNEYLVCETIVEENVDKKKKKISVVMKADIDDTRLNIEINKSSKVFDSTTSEKSKLAMIFFSRTEMSKREYDAKVTEVTQKTKGIDSDEEETDTGVSSETTETSSTTTGGSKVKKANIVKYKVDENDTKKLEAGMKQIFTTARFEPSSGRRAIRKNWRKFKKEIVESLESGGSFPEEVQWDIEDILMEKRYNYVVFAIFDVGVSEVAANTNDLVNVTLTIAEITRLGDGDPVSLGTIGGVQGRGEGSDAEMAKSNAINNAAEKTAKELVALINSKGIN